MNIIEAWEAQNQGKQILENGHKVKLYDKYFTYNLHGDAKFNYHIGHEFSAEEKPLTAEELRKGLEYFLEKFKMLSNCSKINMYDLIDNLKNNQRIWEEEND